MCMLPLAGTLFGTEPLWLVLSPPRFLLHHLSVLQQHAAASSGWGLPEETSIYTVSGWVVLGPRMFVWPVVINKLSVCFSSVCHLLKASRGSQIQPLFIQTYLQSNNTWKKKCWWSTWAPRLPEERASVVQCNTEHSIFPDTLFVNCPTKHFIHHLQHKDKEQLTLGHKDCASTDATTAPDGELWQRMNGCRF